MTFSLVTVAITVLWLINRSQQHRRIRTLAGVLGQFQVEKLMETVADGYLRALGETDPDRKSQIWNMLGQAEATLCAQVQELARALDKLNAEQTRFSTLPWGFPYAVRLLPAHSADMRQLMQIHARGIAALVQEETALTQKDRAFMLTAELLLLQHSCHWFCRSKPVANARMMASHRTPHSQLLASVSAQTRDALRNLGIQ